MNPTTLQALRRLLFFSQPEAASVIGGVTERSWQFWEAGKRTIPDDVIETITQLVAWRNQAIEAASAQIAESGLTPSLIWYNSSDDWSSLPGREPILWRPHCSAIADLCARFGAVAVEFALSDYAKWLGARQDSEAMRSLWAAEKSNAPV